MAADRRVRRSATAGDGLDAGVSRSELILDSANELFRAHGYHSVRIDEIGAKAGITGPGVYRHFPSKPSLLVELYSRVSERLVIEGRRLVDEAASPAQLIDELVAFHVAFALEDRSSIAVTSKKRATFPPT